MMRSIRKGSTREGSHFSTDQRSYKEVTSSLFEFIPRVLNFISQGSRIVCARKPTRMQK